MEMTTHEAFLEWASGHGIGLHRQGSDHLSYSEGVGEERFWMMPFEAAECLSFLTVVLDALGDWKSMWSYTNYDFWTTKPEHSPSYDDQILDTIIRWSGIPEGFAGSVHYDKSDCSHLILLIRLAHQFGFHGFHELYFVPDHGRQFLWLDHEGALFVFFADKSAIDPFVDTLTAFGFPVLTEPPSPYGWQHWMGEKPAGWKYRWEVE